MEFCMLRRLASLFAAAPLVALQAFSNPAVSQERWLAGFYPGWEYEFYPPELIDFSSLTHVVMFSVVPRNDGSLDTSFFMDSMTGPRIAQEVVMRAHAAGRKALLAVGGAGLVERMREASNDANRQRFVTNLVDLVRRWNYDGLDIDWEPIEPMDQANLTALAKALRDQMPDKLLTIDLSWKNSNSFIEDQEARFLMQIEPIFDRLNVMTYDMADNWEGWLSWHNSPLYGDSNSTPASAASSIKAYIGVGIPAGKLGLGVAFYGSCWNTPVSAPRQAAGTAQVIAGDQDMSYKNIMTYYYDPKYAEYDTTAQAPYLSPSKAIGPFGCTFVSYEDERSIAAKGEFARQNGLGGAIIWSLGEGYMPTATNPSGLLHATRNAILD
jgi:chitinase